jgi:CubicO group peptidase (beta-lactamase class C family)
MANGPALDLDGFMAATSGDGLVVLKDGAVAAELYANGTSAQTRHILMSATKSVTGLVAGILATAGRLDLEALVPDYVPEAAGSPYENATLRQLLDMRAGVMLDLEALKRYGWASGWEPIPPGEGPVDLHRFYEALSAEPATHGGPFRYVSANTDLLGWAIERATGERFADLVSALLWRPMGAEADAWITTDARGAARCTGGLCATVRDFARIGQVIAEGGRGIVPAAWIADMAENGDAEAWAKGEFAPGFPGMKMRYRGGWYVIDDGPGWLFAMGIHGQNLFVDRANGVVIAKVSSQGTPFDPRLARLTHRAADELRRLLTGA